jgi:SAM-dependent methyltransferase
MGSGNWAWDRYWQFDRVASCCDEGGRSNYDPSIADGWRSYFASLPAGTRILDLCTGNGAVPLIALEVSEAEDKQFVITGVDRAAIDPAQFAVTRRDRLQKIEFRGEVEAERLPFGDASFGAATSQYGIEYSDLGRSLPEAARVLSPGGRLRFCMHAAEGSVAALTKGQLADADFILDEVGLPARAEEAFTAVLAVERSPAPSDELKVAGDIAFAAFGDALAATAARLPQAADQKMLHSSGAVLAHAFENRGHFELQVLLDKVAEIRMEVEAHRIRQRALVDAAVTRERLVTIALQLESLGLVNVETAEVRPGEDRLIGYVVSGELRR